MLAGQGLWLLSPLRPARTRSSFLRQNRSKIWEFGSLIPACGAGIQRTREEQRGIVKEQSRSPPERGARKKLCSQTARNRAFLVFRIEFAAKRKQAKTDAGTVRKSQRGRINSPTGRVFDWRRVALQALRSEFLPTVPIASQHRASHRRRSLIQVPRVLILRPHGIGVTAPGRNQIGSFHL
jgi:hypothetical protein